MGDANFTMMILLPAYMNSALSDSLNLRMILWADASEITRQMTITKEAANSLIDCVTSKVRDLTELYQTHFNEQFSHLLDSYRTSLEKGLVTESRNPAVYFLAKQQLELV